MGAPQPSRHAARGAFDDGAQRRARLARTVHQRFPALGRSGIGAEERIAINLFEVEVRRVDRIAADLGDPGMDPHLGNHQPCDAARRDARRGLARARPAAAAIVADAIFGVIGIIGVAGAISLGDVAIILRPLIDIVDHQADRCAGGLALEHARQDAHPVGFLPLRRVARLAGAALVEERLDVVLAERQPRRAAVDNRAERGPVAFPPGGEAQNASEAVETHLPLSPWGRGRGPRGAAAWEGEGSPESDAATTRQTPSKFSITSRFVKRSTRYPSRARNSVRRAS